nr:unnamed protein product [Callosobruchus analis]
MKVVVALVSALAVVQAVSHQELWNQFKAEHNKVYLTLNEEQARINVFQSNLRSIEQHNAKYENGEETYYLKVTQFADMTSDEFKRFLSLGEKTKPNFDLEVIETDSSVVPPDSVDWRQKGAVLKVGASWAFSAVSCTYSEENETKSFDCIDNIGDNPMIEAFKYAKYNGIDSEVDYPSTASKHNCSFDKDRSILLVDQIYSVKPTEEALKSVVGNNFAFYGGGVFNPTSCSASHLNHAVLAVGYGSEGNRDFWIVKNSWGVEWGEDGYIRMIRNQANHCGIASMASAATVK